MAGVTIVSPKGNPEVWPESKVQEKLAQGYITQAEWQAQCEAKAAAEHAAWLADPATEEGRFRMLRSARDARIAATDYLLNADYPIDAALLSEVTAYRQALRDLPGREGAPWDGGGEATPWPEKPAAVKL